MKSTFGRAAAVKTIDAATATAARDSRHILLKGAGLRFSKLDFA